jgi:hypothetical protein
MKILTFGILFFALTFCNLINRFTGQQTSGPADNKSNSSSQSPESKPASAGDAAAEKAELTPQQSALIEGGKEAKWDEQGLSWTVPSGWKKMTAESKTLMWGSGGAFLIVNISPMAADFPADISTKAFYDGAVTRKQNGEIERVRYLEIDGVKGVEFVETMAGGKDSPRRHQWMAYRKYAGQMQLVNVMLSTKGAAFEKHQDEFTAILYSTKLVK